MTLAAGTIVFSVSLLEPESRTESHWLRASWIAELLSVLLGLSALLAYLRFYVSPYEARMFGKRIEVGATPFWLFVGQAVTFAAGLGLLALFAFS